MQIYWIKAQAPRRVLALTKHLGLDAEFVHLDFKGLKSPEYAKLNPNLKAPTLVDGEKVLWEASSIMAYLCLKTGSDMWPVKEPEKLVEVMRWISWNDCHWARAAGEFYFEHIIKKTFHIGEPDRAKLKAATPQFETMAKILDDHLAGKTFVACDRLTIADFQLAAMCTDWEEAEMPMEKLSNIVRWNEGLKKIPAWSSPWPTN